MRIFAVLAMLMLAACGGRSTGRDEPSLVAPATVGPAASNSEVAIPPPDLPSARELLECEGAISQVGGAGEALALDVGVGGSSPARALKAFLAATPFVIPLSGYETLGVSGDRYAYGYRADGEVKVVVVMSPRFAGLVGEAFAPDELRTCPDSEFGSAVDFGDGRRVWTHVETGEIITDIPGPEHCGWQSARMLHVERDGALVAQYLRDPEGVFAGLDLLETYAQGVELPDDASDSGYRSPEGFELWFTESNTALYVVTPDGNERWPRADEPIGCA